MSKIIRKTLVPRPVGWIDAKINVVCSKCVLVQEWESYPIPCGMFVNEGMNVVYYLKSPIRYAVLSR
jgi:hypothetical protein